MQNEEIFEKELKARLIEMTSWFHELCVKNGIRYYAIDGTMLGAARHQGFIPWDDDIDVGVPRADYERLARLMEEKPDGRYVYETPRSPAPEFIYTFSKLYDTSTTLVQRARTDIRRGVYIDVFPLDGLGSTIEDARRNFGKIDRLFSLYSSRVLAVRPGRKFYKNAAVRLIQALPECLINTKRLQLKVDEACREHDYDECAIVGNLVGAWRFRDVVEKSVIGDPVPYKFENLTIFGVSDFDAYLTHLYGAWREFPPKEKQVSHHEFVECDLHKPYM